MTRHGVENAYGTAGAHDKGAVDEVARQRKKRAERALECPIPGFGQLNLRSLLGQVMVGVEESGGSFDVHQFLVDQGHSADTIAAVVGVLHITEPMHPSRTVSPVRDR